jgi:hypothetical protein
MAGSARLAFAEGRVSGRVDWLQSDRFTLRIRGREPEGPGHDCTFQLTLPSGACAGRSRVAHSRRDDRGTLLTVTILSFDSGEDAFAEALRAQLATPTAELEELHAMDAERPAHRPHPERHHWDNEERFWLR